MLGHDEYCLVGAWSVDGRVEGEVREQASQDHGGLSEVQRIHLKILLIILLLKNWSKARRNVEIRMIGKGEPNEESSNGDKEEDVKKLITQLKPGL